MSSTEIEHTVPFIHIPQGKGATVRLPTLHVSNQNERAISRVGTTGCYGCVGVYIPLSKETSFVAQICAATRRRDEDDRIDGSNQFTPKDQEGDSLEQFIKDEIINVVGSRWAPAEDYRERVILVCSYRNDPSLGRAQGTPLVGHHIVNAVIDCLGLDQSCFKDGKEGFVVNHPTQEVRLFQQALGKEDVLANSGFERISMDEDKMTSWCVDLWEDDGWSEVGEWDFRA